VKNGCVVYSLIFAVYSWSIGIFGSRTNDCVYGVGGADVRACWAKSGGSKSAAAAAIATADAPAEKSRRVGDEMMVMIRQS